MTFHTDTMENHEMTTIGHDGWKYYNKIRKKAMEQEFSWSGLFLSLSIDFFIVISIALLLSLFHESFVQSNISNNLFENNIYRLEITGVNNININNYINTDHIEENRLIIESISEIA